MAELQDHSLHTVNIDRSAPKTCYISHPKKTEHIAVQHGSPELRRNYVYPAQPTPIAAFQMPSSHQSPKCGRQEYRSIPKGSPVSVRAARIQDSPVLNSDTEESVNKIRALFPTVSETHIRLLLKKYHGREVVVISALQVEKHPISTPGPHPTPPPVHAPTYQLTSPPGFRVGVDSPRPGSGRSSAHTGSPTCRSSPRTHSSPKLKLRYMKSLFPKPDETIILDVLASNDNDIQKTTEALKQMGFEKKETKKLSKRKVQETPEEQKKPTDEHDCKSAIPVVPKLKTLAEKEKIVKEMQQKYSETPGHLIAIALESVNYDEKRADQILQIITQEEQRKLEETASQSPEKPQGAPKPEETPAIPPSQSRQSLKSLLKSEKADVFSFSRKIDEDASYKSSLLSDTKGADPGLSRGPDGRLLLNEYVTCKGPDSGLRKGPRGLAKGPNPANLAERRYRAAGANKGLRKGPEGGLAKGTIFAQLKEMICGESRGK